MSLLRVITSTSPALVVVLIQDTQCRCHFLGYKIHDKPPKYSDSLRFSSFPGGEEFHNKSARLLENVQVVEKYNHETIFHLSPYTEIIIIDLNHSGKLYLTNNEKQPYIYISILYVHSFCVGCYWH